MSLELSGTSRLEIIGLVRRCSKTLQIFKIKGFDTENVLFNMLKNGMTGEFIVYSRMRYLKAGFQLHRNYDRPYPTYPGAVPFPNLQRLVTYYGYSFGGDVLSRGSQHALHSIKVDITSIMAKHLTDNNTFTGAIIYIYQYLLDLLLLATSSTLASSVRLVSSLATCGGATAYLRCLIPKMV